MKAKALQAHVLSPVSLMCLSGAVVGQNSKSIKQLVHPSPWRSPGKIYWLRQQPRHTGTSSFFSWLAGYLELHRSMGLMLSQGTAMPSEGLGDCDIKVCSHFTCQRGLTFSTTHYQPSSSGSSAVERQLILNQWWLVDLQNNFFRILYFTS